MKPQMDADARRIRLLRAVHAEGKKRGLDHDGLRDVCRLTFGVGSMKELGEEELKALYHDWTGRGLRRRTELPRRGKGEGSTTLAVMASGEDLETLAAAFAARGWGKETQRQFIRRQLSGREVIRRRGDFWRVFSGVRAMNRRDAVVASSAP